MIQKLKRIGIVFLFLFAAGCAKEPDVYFETAEDTEQIQTLAVQDVIEQEQREESCFVHVCGEVRNPGVYQLKPGSRIYEAVALAGGMTECADFDSINQAQIVSDGMMVRIPSIEEGAADVLEPQQEDGKLNLNTADITELMTLPGIGMAKAESIIAYREEKGGFASVEEIMQVDGIKEGVYNRLKDSVTVR